MNLLFLYTEISGYFLGCAEKLAELSGGQVHVVRWKVNNEAPFSFRERKNVKLHERDAFNAEGLQQFCRELNPAFIYVAGRVDKDYLSVAKFFKPTGIPVVFGFDNHWTGALKQRLFAFLSPLFLKSRFTHVWIPGQPQLSFAQKLGYTDEKILKGVYAGEINSFLEAGEKCRPEKNTNYPHTLLFCGRLVEAKGIVFLVNTFLKLKKEFPNLWKLVIAGTGPQESLIPNDPSIQKLGFLQPENLPSLVSQAGAFILPSNFEPWGVALHEFAAGGLPVIASGSVGAASAFLQEGKNGFGFEAGNEDSLKKALKKLFSTPDSKLLEMGEVSKSLALKITPEGWANTVIKLLKK